jgi:hypothetical protein
MVFAMKASALVICISVVLCSAQADGLRTQIETSNKKIHAAMLKKDMDAFAKAMKPDVTPDFKYMEDGRSMGFDQMVGLMKQSFTGFQKVTKAETKILSLKQTKTSATSVSDHAMAGIMPGPDGKPHTMTFTGTSTETYVKKGGKWLLSIMSWGKSKMLLDGKPMDMSKMAPAPRKAASS